MISLDDSIKDDVKLLKKEGKKTKAILEHVKIKFGRTISTSTVYYILRENKPSKKEKKPGQKKTRDDQETIVGITEDIYEKIGDLKNAYIANLKGIRGQLIETTAKLRESAG